MEAPWYVAPAAIVPLVALAGLVLTSKASLAVAAWASAAAAGLLALTLFGLPPLALGYAVAKGAWTGAWILLIVVPALLLFEVAERAGALDRLSDQFSSLAPTPARRILLIGWIFPAFLQGVAGYGTPVVVAAPMLARAGFEPAVAVAAVLVGYHWAVTFGSMGSSFFVAAGTAGLGAEASTEFALRAAALLAVNALVAGLLVLRRVKGEAREAIPAALCLAVVMGATLLAVVSVEPALGSTTAGLAGLAAAALLLPRKASGPRWSVLLTAAAPYLLLTGSVVIVVGVPAIADLAARVPALALSFPATEAAFGHVNEAVAAHRPFEPLLHPAVHLLLAAVAGCVLYSAVGWLSQVDRRRVLPGWARRSDKVIASLIGLLVLAGVMVDAGMIGALAEALTAALGYVYVGIVPVLGLLGTVLTGSTTASNALLSPLQAGAADRLSADVAALLAGQTAGGNVGNAITPVNVLVASVAAGCQGQEGTILRRAARDAVPLLLLVIAGTLLMTLL